MSRKIKRDDHKKLYRKWAGIKQRCNNPNCERYPNYGGRGITYEPAWEYFDNFFNDMSESYYKHVEEFGEKDTTLDRINVDGNYCKENCRWATWEEQARNKSSTLYICGIPLVEWCEKNDFNYSTLVSRLNSCGWSEEDAISIPVGKRPSKYFDKEDNTTLVQMCKELKLNYNTVHGRLKLGWSLVDALTIPIKHPVDYKSILGKSLAELASEYGVSYGALKYRMHNGWDIIDAICTSIKQNYDFGGKSLRQICIERGVKYSVMLRRIHDGWDLNTALNTPYRGYGVFDHLGDKPLKDLCKDYNMCYSIVYNRLRSGWSLKDALTTPVKKVDKKFIFDGKPLRQICIEQDKDYELVRGRLRAGWSLEEALHTPKIPKGHTKDYFGNIEANNNDSTLQ